MNKNYRLLVILVFLVSTVDMDEVWLPDKIETSKVTIGQASDGEYDLLGFSYDITGDYLHVDNAKKWS